jgi:hypothetical protein
MTGISVRVKRFRHPEHPLHGKQAIVADVRGEDGSVRCFAQIKYGEWVEYPEAGHIPVEAFH